MKRAVSMEGHPVHRMQPQTGAVPKLQIAFNPDGSFEFSMFCRTGHNKGKWYFKDVPFEMGLVYLKRLSTWTQEESGLCYLTELEELFQWKWDSTSLPEAKAMSLSLSDLGL